MSDTVTLQIGGLENEDILVTSNIKIAFICNTIDELVNYIEDIHDLYQEGESVVAYVKTVNKAVDNTVLQYQNAKGMYYLFNWENNGWDTIVLGSHTHENMELLDQLGNINTDDLKLNDRKILVIKKVNNVNPDYDNGDYDGVYTYKFEYEDLNQIPSLPETPGSASDEPLYLSVDKHGNYNWVNRLVPAQTFSCITVEVGAENVNVDASRKNVTISKRLFENTNFKYDDTIGDAILVFDSGRLLSDIVVSQDNLTFTLTINNVVAGETFDPGETITILVLHDGARTIINDLDNRYATKEDLLEVQTGGEISLSGYPTMEDMKTYAPPRNHTHDQYITKPALDNGFLDWRYASFYHQHSEYVTEAELYKFNQNILKSVTFKIGDVFQVPVITVGRICININRPFVDGDIFQLFVGPDNYDFDTTNNDVILSNGENGENVNLTEQESYVYEFNKNYASSKVLYLYPYFNGAVDPTTAGYVGDGDITIYYN